MLEFKFLFHTFINFYSFKFTSFLYLTFNVKCILLNALMMRIEEERDEYRESIQISPTIIPMRRASLIIPRFLIGYNKRALLSLSVIATSLNLHY